MEPYQSPDPWVRREAIGDATLYLGDCRQILPALPSVYAVVTDPPYGIGYVARRRDAGGRITIAGDEVAPLWCVPLIARLIAPGGALYLATRFDVSPAWRGAIERAGLGVRTPIYWDKGNHTIGDCVGDFGGQVEIFLFAHRGHHRLRAGRPPNLWKLARPAWTDWETGGHPTPKPVGLLMRMIECSTDPGDVVLDPFMGSGATAIAALRLGRRFIGSELNPGYFRHVCERIELHLRQGDFLRPPPRRPPPYAPPLPLEPEPIPPVSLPIPAWRGFYDAPAQGVMASLVGLDRPAPPPVPATGYRAPTQSRLI